MKLIKTVVLASVMFVSANSFAGQICNRSTEQVAIAIGIMSTTYSDTGISMIPMKTKGWYNFEIGDCKSFPLASDEGLYFFGKGREGTEWTTTGNTYWCINESAAFEMGPEVIANRAKCLQNGHRMAGMVGVGRGNYDITGGNTNSKVKLCNQNTEDLYFAIATWSNNNWNSNGYYLAPKGDCKVIDLGKYNGDFYTAPMKHGAWTYGGDAEFCVDTKNSFTFTFADSRDCSAGDLRRVKMKKYTSIRGTKVINFR